MEGDKEAQQDPIELTDIASKIIRENPDLTGKQVVDKLLGTGAVATEETVVPVGTTKAILRLHEILFGKDVLSLGVERENFEFFLNTIADALETFLYKNKLYDSSWHNDGLDFRVLFGEINAKHRRQKSMVWDNFEELSGSPARRTQVYETVVDSVLYQLMLARRMTLEAGPVDLENYKKLRDQT